MVLGNSMLDLAKIQLFFGGSDQTHMCPSEHRTNEFTEPNTLLLLFAVHFLVFPQHLNPSIGGIFFFFFFVPLECSVGHPHIIQKFKLKKMRSTIKTPYSQTNLHNLHTTKNPIYQSHSTPSYPQHPARNNLSTFSLEEKKKEHIIFRFAFLPHLNIYITA